jgi:Flp pilus assembly protein TadD
MSKRGLWSSPSRFDQPIPPQIRRLKEATAVCEWNVQQYPHSWRAENALASTHRARGDLVQARVHY